MGGKKEAGKLPPALLHRGGSGRNGHPEFKPYYWRAGDAQRQAGVAEFIAYAKWRAARRNGRLPAAGSAGGDDGHDAGR
jgi:hypothetical protein